ncbi:DUF3087 domain-containing protein [Aliamphritea ceti]|uniref:DUF3087 domain-containing protein n=1 Tax=Aliamphritea ceti TaxID=1524258 RepID=UPI0021C333C4|nr:DUF3087 domain-containing protein [Aliamphritea ceti]
MQLQEIDKERYSKHYKIVFVAVAVVLLVVSLTVSTVLIQVFTDGDGSHFWLNLSGVAVAALVVGSLLRRYRRDVFMFEVMYVWDLKQMLNKIYRKQAKIKAAMAEGNADAMQIMNFSYQGSKQLYLLDNNTLTMEELNKSMTELDALAEDFRITLALEQFNPAMLEAF